MLLCLPLLQSLSHSTIYVQFTLLEHFGGQRGKKKQQQQQTETMNRRCDITSRRMWINDEAMMSDGGGINNRNIFYMPEINVNYSNGSKKCWTLSPVQFDSVQLCSVNFSSFLVEVGECVCLRCTTQLNNPIDCQGVHE